MPASRTPRPVAVRAAGAAAVLLLALTGCSLLERDSAGDAGREGPSSAATSGPSASVDASAASVQAACARVLETVRTAPQQLQEDPAGLFLEVDELAATAPDELSGQITSVREAVADFRQGERSLAGVVREVRDLQERCSR
ncbi:hypothetical protein ACH9DO_07985 [Kocuria sp. M1N1S27]|uniref:hypothetical protein n=1 Tax=Kocuria kalidii TaxID=3376283 RepID=UPI003788CCC5